MTIILSCGRLNVPAHRNAVFDDDPLCCAGAIQGGREKGRVQGSASACTPTAPKAKLLIACTAFCAYWSGWLSRGFQLAFFHELLSALLRRRRTGGLGIDVDGVQLTSKAARVGSTVRWNGGVSALQNAIGIGPLTPLRRAGTRDVFPLFDRFFGFICFPAG